MVHVYTGNGKGKTTASLGLICRALGREFKVCLIQFMKKNDDYGEIRFLSTCPDLTIYQFGSGSFVNPKAPLQADFDEVNKAFQQAREALSCGYYQLVVLDEINVAVSFRLLEMQKQLELMHLAQGTELVMTGRGVALEVLELADLVTEMKEVKHYYNKGIEARCGIEF